MPPALCRVVTRRQISQQEKRVTRKAQRVETYGISEAALREAQTAARVQKTEFVTVFQPEEVCVGWRCCGAGSVMLTPCLSFGAWPGQPLCIEVGHLNALPAPRFHCR